MNGWEKQTLENCVVILENSAIVPAGGCVPSQSWRAICTLWVWGLRDALYTIIIVSLYVCVCACAKSLQSCLTLCNTMDCSPPGSSVYGILQARILEWVATPSSRGSSWPSDPTCVSYVSCTGRQVFTSSASVKFSIPFFSMIPLLLWYSSLKSGLQRLTVTFKSSPIRPHSSCPLSNIQ